MSRPWAPCRNCTAQNPQGQCPGPACRSMSHGAGRAQQHPRISAFTSAIPGCLHPCCRQAEAVPGPSAALREKMGCRRASGADCCQRGEPTPASCLPTTFSQEKSHPSFLPSAKPPSIPALAAHRPLRVPAGRPALSALGRAGTGHRLGSSSKHHLQKAQSGWSAGQGLG